MKKNLLILSTWAVLLACAAGVHADPQADLKEFQGYFVKHFPQVPFKDFANGVYALDKSARAEWESVMAFPPYEVELDQGKKIWETPFKNGKNFASCFRNKGIKIAQRYPYWDDQEQQVRTLEMDINTCLKRNGEPEYTDLEKGAMAQVVAYMKSLSHGEIIQIDLSKPGALAAYEEGKRFYWARRGQLNFSCATCHVQNVGKFIRGDSLSAGLGHGVAFPVYRAKHGYLTTLHERYKGCNEQVRAKPFGPQSPEYRHLELYEAYMNTGLPLNGPSYRR